VTSSSGDVQGRFASQNATRQLARALAGFAAAVERAPDLEAESRCAGWSIGAVVAHVIEVTDRFSAFAADEERWRSADLAAAVDRSAASWHGIDPARTCELSFGSFDALAAAGINTFDALVHTWDVDPTFVADHDLVVAASVVAEQLVWQERHYDRPPTDVQPRTPFERLLLLTGRDPR
jgi:hypothetical protein